MIVSRNIKWRHVFYYTWRSMLYFFLLSLTVYILHIEFDVKQLSIPFNAVATLSTALAIYLGFKNNNAYDRWWEARKIWGLLVNYSRAWGRQALTLPVLPMGGTEFELRAWQKKVIYRHIAFVHALRVFLRKKHDYNQNGVVELIEESNRFEDIRDFLSPEEFEEARTKRNPPNYLLLLQSDDLREAYKQGWLSDYRFTQLEATLTEFNNHQGRSERIKNTPLPRAYSFYSRVFVFLHGTLVPLAFIEDLGWLNIPLSLIINFVFLALDQIGERTEDPFENRMEDTPLTNISVTIEENLKEMYGDNRLPKKPEPMEGVVF
uniref:Bestrophin family ion channel n=1 Tax=Roseihalotalea indica TaxID=2867963 RepID=A0AA49JFT7_9BACT|nr:bestrophin family ion channel [Tunicatimonas sp. TK19036]